jgi:polysaccharide deacetylase family protein (PEP-CTERM system associated)
MLNAITVDVEDWFHVSLFRNMIKTEDWASLESRVVDNVCRVLKIFKDYDVKGTFFILGWVAERYPALVRTIAEYGHDIGSHGYSHQLIYEQTPEQFGAELRKSITILRDLSARDILAYRAPSFSITHETFWSLNVLHQCGIEFDSSIFPIKHDLYGQLDSPQEIFRVPLGCNGDMLIECPPSTITVLGTNFPIAGGAYLRLFPLWLIAHGIRRLNRAGRPAIIYFHPWELDPLQPRMPVGILKRLRHYGNLDVTEEKLRYLLKTFQFGPLQQVVAATKVDRVWPEWNHAHA